MVFADIYLLGSGISDRNSCAFFDACGIALCGFYNVGKGKMAGLRGVSPVFCTRHASENYHLSAGADGIICAAVGAANKKVGLTSRTLLRLGKVAVVFSIPLLVGASWSAYADGIKSLNLHGAELTSSKLVFWNFGNLEQRLSWDFWYTVILKRSLITNVGAGVFGLPFLIMVPILAWRRGSRKPVWLALLCLALFLLPIAIFANLHIIHSYYQAACHVWLGCAVAVLLGASLTWYPYHRGLAALTAFFFVFLNFVLFFLSYYPHISLTARDEGPAQQAYEVGKFLHENTQVGSGIVVYNQNYSAEIAFHSERKAMTVMDGSPYTKEILLEPQRFLGDAPLSAITVCPMKTSFPSKNDL